MFSTVASTSSVSSHLQISKSQKFQFLIGPNRKNSDLIFEKKPFNFHKDDTSNEKYNRFKETEESKKGSSMAIKHEVIEIDDFSPSPVRKNTPLKPVFCLKNREEMKKFEEKEDCFILEFDPYDGLDVLRLPWSENDVDAEAELIVVGERGQVACRDFPHPRNTCARYPFEKTPHHSHCKLCYCYVCDSSAPCRKWTGSAGHCHAFNNEAWNNEKQLRRLISKTV